MQAGDRKQEITDAYSDSNIHRGLGPLSMDFFQQRQQEDKIANFLKTGGKRRSF